MMSTLGQFLDLRERVVGSAHDLARCVACAAHRSDGARASRRQRASPGSRRPRCRRRAQVPALRDRPQPAAGRTRSTSGAVQHDHGGVRPSGSARRSAGDRRGPRAPRHSLGNDAASRSRQTTLSPTYARQRKSGRKVSRCHSCEEFAIRVFDERGCSGRFHSSVGRHLLVHDDADSRSASHVPSLDVGAAEKHVEGCPGPLLPDRREQHGAVAFGTSQAWRQAVP